MDARSAVQRMVAILVMVVGTSFPVFAGTVCIYGGDFDLPIPAESDDTKGWMHDAIINVPDHHTISNLDVRIGITHTNVFDLQIFLQSPAGRVICLSMYNPFDEFFVGANYTNTIFDDEAVFSIKEGEAPFTGRFRPIEPYRLSVFDDEDTYGAWRLQICDMWPADTGSLNSFELMITTPEPATAILLTLGVGLICLHKRRRNLNSPP